jgi:hypothetical protein
VRDVHLLGRDRDLPLLRRNMSCRHSLANTTCSRCYPKTGVVDPGPEEEYLERESRRLPTGSSDEEVKMVNARVAAAEIYVTQVKPGEVKFTVELQLEYVRKTTQLTGKLRSPYVGHLMQAAGVDRWSDVVGKIVRVRCSREKVYAVGHSVEDVWVEIR